MATILSLLRSIAGADGPFEAFSASDPAGRPLLLARVGLVAVVWWTAASAGDARSRRWLAGAGAALVASLLARAAFLPFAALVLVAVWRSRRSFLAATAILLGAAALAAMQSQAPPPDPFVGTDPAAETLRWSRRDNVFWAHAWASRWAAGESRPGPALLSLARTTWALGHADDARRLATLVATQSDDPEVRDQASKALQAWRGAP